MKQTRLWQYRNTMLLVLSLLLLFLFADSAVVHTVIRQMGEYGYIGAFVAGIFFVSTFTVAPASLLLFHLAQEFGALGIALSAGAGAVIGDLLIFRFFKDRVFEEFRPLMTRVGNSSLGTLFQSPYFGWFTPVLGAIIIASPLPDEVGIGLMGLTRITQWQFVVLTYLLNAAGIFIVVLLAQTV